VTEEAPDEIKYGISDEIDISFEDFIADCPYCGEDGVTVRNFSDGYHKELAFNCEVCGIIRYNYE